MIENFSKKYLFILSRFFISLFFIVLSVDKILNFADAVAKIENAGVTYIVAVIIILASITIGIFASIFLILDFRTKLSAWVLIAFTIVGTATFHIDFSSKAEIFTLFRNIAIIGGLLHVTLYDRKRDNV